VVATSVASHLTLWVHGWRAELSRSIPGNVVGAAAPYPGQELKAKGKGKDKAIPIEEQSFLRRNVRDLLQLRVV
jgi:hypothetical protein